MRARDTGERERAREGFQEKSREGFRERALERHWRERVRARERDCERECHFGMCLYDARILANRWEWKEIGENWCEGERN